ncbi:hypothetical protein KSC_038350 [Ktedonobacter sp. SOSP1-52]|uniref:SDR family NAD(P)-dependent oxidoreductase n=1 Tax=Ktedonobacter sp. SOSP1-52 TaxID=2778366 RepID=UPI001916567B|nr:SDR family NAD(P)-dependent oxidoreductase [Ktedonobacter sp. SOSP1-52]GHO64943.1 hypothetical protein KSC_038350 [Ktedonobacter sp. SOSP1-52]
MTDLRHHLKSIVACLKKQAGTGVEGRSQCKEELAKLLPASYGVGEGYLVNEQGERSQWLDIIIVDKTLPLEVSQQTETECDERTALLVARLADEVDKAGLVESVEAIASAKALRDIGKRQAQQGKVKLKHLLPLGAVFVQRLQLDQGYEEGSHEAYSQAMYRVLQRQREVERPDYLSLLVPGLSYVNPCLEGENISAITIGITREPELLRTRLCYRCKQRFTRRHFFYDLLCLQCGDLNYQKRQSQADLRGRLALVTGARIHIGYATVLRLLRAGATVIATTRFPHDAAQRYSAEPDFEQWRERLHIYSLDLRHLSLIEYFIAHIKEHYGALDILINNAAQTVKRAYAYYAPLLAYEQRAPETLPAAQQELVARSHAFMPPVSFIAEVSNALALPIPTQAETGAEEQQRVSQVSNAAEGTQLDLRRENSWSQRIEEIDLTEFLEVQVINVTAPFLLVKGLTDLLRHSPFPQRFIINVSAVEGRFAQNKLGTHVHTNMAKAALNMLTHTAAADLAQDNIYMNSVDPGWVTRQAPATQEAIWQRAQESMPLDMQDAAARICDPIWSAINDGQLEHGRFYKDYTPSDW